MITRTRLGKVQVFKEDAYQEPETTRQIKDTLVGYGYSALEARSLAREIRRNLDVYLVAMDSRARIPTQTLQQQREANANLRV